MGCGCWTSRASLNPGSSPGARPGPDIPAAWGTQAPAGPPGWERAPQAGMQPVELPPGPGCGRGEPPAFLEGSKDWGLSKAWRAGGPGHCPRAPEGRAALAGLAWGQSRLGCGQEGALHCPGPGVRQAHAGAARPWPLPSLPPARPCAQGGALGELVGWELGPGPLALRPRCLAASCPIEAGQARGAGQAWGRGVRGVQAGRALLLQVGGWLVTTCSPNFPFLQTGSSSGRPTLASC